MESRSDRTIKKLGSSPSGARIRRSPRRLVNPPCDAASRNSWERGSVAWGAGTILSPEFRPLRAGRAWLPNTPHPVHGSPGSVDRIVDTPQGDVRISHSASEDGPMNFGAPSDWHDEIHRSEAGWVSENGVFALLSHPGGMIDVSRGIHPTVGGANQRRRVSDGSCGSAGIVWNGPSSPGAHPA
jgi:hypothetical protein